MLPQAKLERRSLLMPVLSMRWMWLLIKDWWAHQWVFSWHPWDSKVTFHYLPAILNVHDWFCRRVISGQCSMICCVTVVHYVIHTALCCAWLSGPCWLMSCGGWLCFTYVAILVWLCWATESMLFFDSSLFLCCYYHYDPSSFIQLWF